MSNTKKDDITLESLQEQINQLKAEIMRIKAIIGTPASSTELEIGKI